MSPVLDISVNLVGLKFVETKAQVKTTTFLLLKQLQYNVVEWVQREKQGFGV